MRLMTYNVLTGGRDGTSDARLAPIIRLIQGVSPDILVLNECNGFERDGSRTLYRLEAELGMRGVLAQAQTGFHVALFFRRGRLLDVHCLNRELHHAALCATFELGGAVVKVIGAHLTPFGGDARLLEIQHLIRFLREEHVFILGDLNALSPHDAHRYSLADWLPRRRARHVLPASGGAPDTRALSLLEEAELVDVFQERYGAGAPPTALTSLGVGAPGYQVRIDYVLATRAAAARVTNAERVDGPLAESASDHYALFVDAEL